MPRAHPRTRRRAAFSARGSRHPAGYRLATAEILYHMPDHPNLLQTYVWQGWDLAPRYPALRAFLDFWRRELDGALHSVRVASAAPERARGLRHTPVTLTLH